MLRARSPTAGNRSWVAKIRCSSAWPTSSRSPSSGQRLGQPLPQERDDHRDVGRRPLLGQEDPEHGLFQRGRALEVVRRRSAPSTRASRLRNVVRQRRRARRRGSAGRCGSTRAGCAPGCRPGLLAGRPVAAELGQVGEHLQQLDLRLERTVVELGPRGQVARTAPGARRAGRRRSRAAGCAGRRCRAPTRARRRQAGRLGRQVQVDGLGLAAACGRRRRRRSAPGAAAARRSPPGCRRRPGTPAPAP